MHQFLGTCVDKIMSTDGGQTNRQMDGVKQISPPQTLFAGGIRKHHLPITKRNITHLCGAPILKLVSNVVGATTVSVYIQDLWQVNSGIPVPVLQPMEHDVQPSTKQDYGKIIQPTPLSTHHSIYTCTKEKITCQTLPQHVSKVEYFINLIK